MDLAGSTVLLTGVGGEGQVGEAVAAAFAAAGASLVLVDRSAANVEARAAALRAAGGRAAGYACDLTDAAQTDGLVERVRAAHGESLHALVHMAGGFAMSGPVAESLPEIWHKQIGINLTTAYLAARGFLPLLRADRGALVFFSSQAAAPGASGARMAAYAAAKSGVAALMRAIAAEEQGNGVRANALAPNAIRTAANVAAMGADARYVEREDVARTVLFLCSDAGRAINGQFIALG